MNSYREKNTQYMNEEIEHTTTYAHPEYASRNEYVEENQNNLNQDFSSLLYYNAPERIPAPKAKEYLEEDVMPSQTTMQFSSNKQDLEISRDLERSFYTYEYEESRIEEGEDKQYKINAKAKVLIAVYALVVVTIFALIVLNTRLLKTMNSDVAVMEEQIQTLTEKQESLRNKLNQVSSDSEIEKKALEFGMVKE